MKRILVLFAIAAFSGLLMLGCQSDLDKAQKLFSEGKYQDLIEQYGNTAGMEQLVMDSKEKLAEALNEEGKYDEVMEMYPDTKAAMAAKEMAAMKLLEEMQYEELLAKYPDSKAAAQAKLKLAEARGDSLADVAGKKGAELKEAKETIGRAAERELERVLNIKNPRLRAKALEEFVNNPKFAGTDAVKKAKELM